MAKAKKEADVLEVEAEEIPEVPVEVALQLAIEHEVKKFDPYEARMNELKEKYSGIKINGISDKEGIEKNRHAIADLRTIRVNTEKERKQIKAPFLKAASDIEVKAQWIISGVSQIEEPLKAQKKEIQDEIDRLDREETNRIAERKKVRAAQLTEMGAQFNGVDYVLGDVAYSLDTIAAADGEIYDSKILPRYKEVFEKNEVARKEEEKKKADDDARIAKEKKDFEDQQIAFREQQEQLRKDQEKRDKEKMRDQEHIQNRRVSELSQYRRYLPEYDVSELWKLPHAQYDELLGRVKADYEKDEASIKMAEEADRERKEKQGKRISQLYELGLKFDFSSSYFINFDVFIHTLDVQNYSDERWDEMIKTTAVHIFAFKEKEAEKENARIEKEKQAAIEKALEEKNKADELAELKRQQEIEEGKESVKYAETVNYLKATPIYKFRSGLYIKKISFIKDFLADLK